MQPLTPARSLKYAIDRVAALLLLLALAPLLLLLAVAVRVLMGSPVLFRQMRAGYQRRPFEIFKFRSMREDTSAPDTSLFDASAPNTSLPNITLPDTVIPDTARLTPLGRLLRRTGLDELPQLFNIARGEMSFVGPRPLLVRYLPFFSSTENLRHEVRPGLTGWAQIHGRNQSRWDERLARDVWYVRHWSLALDLRIAALTILLLAGGKGFEAAPTAAMADLDAERAAPAAGPR
jgi:lipopolysaccharide/colanic/teichoic acid biosynthesis glycosyltransferase